MLRHPSELPRTDALLDEAGCGDAPRAVVLAAVRSVVQAARARLIAGGEVDGDGIVQFQCHGKKTSFFMMALIGQIILLALHGLCSIGAVMWCLFFR